MATITTARFEEIPALRDSFEDSLKARNRAPLTIKSYKLAIDQLHAFLKSKGMPTEVRSIRREHIEAYLVDMQERGAKPATVAQRFRSLQQWCRWLVEADEIDRSPMERMRPPKVEAPLVPVLREDQVRKLLRACDGSDYAARRDKAVISLFLDTGMRRQEMASLLVDDVDWERRVITIRSGKGDRPRLVRFTVATRLVLIKYARERDKHPRASSSALWLGRSGPMTSDGIRDIVARRGEAAGLVGLHPHVFRHSRAHTLLSDGMEGQDVQLLMGWRSPLMLRRYGASAATERALDAFDRVTEAKRR